MYAQVGDMVRRPANRLDELHAQCAGFMPHHPSPERSTRPETLPVQFVSWKRDRRAVQLQQMEEITVTEPFRPRE